MKKAFIKPIAVLSLTMLLGSSVITGCSLVTRDYNKYYNQTAGEITLEDGSKIKITRKELRTAVSAYGFDQYLQQGLTEDQVYEQTLDFLVARKLSILEMENISKAQNGNGKVLTQKEEQYLFEKVYEGLENNISSKLEIIDDETQPENTTTQPSYEKKVELQKQGDEYTLKILDEISDEVANHKYFSDGSFVATNDAGKEELFKLILSYVGTDKAKKDAYNDYIRNLRENEKIFELSKDAKEVFFREIDRLYTIFYENLMVNKYRNLYLEEIDSQGLINDIVELYESKVKKDYVKFEVENASYIDSVQENSANIYFFDDDVEFFYVSHILVSFDDEEKAEFDYNTQQINNIKEDKGAEKSLEYYENEIENLYTSLKSLERQEIEENVWQEVENGGKGIDELLEYVKTKINGLSTEEEKLERFEDLVFEFNEDPGAMSGETPYLIGVGVGEDNNGEIYSKWVESFNDAGLELFNNGNGEVGEVYSGSIEDGGAGLIRSDYGVHIMMFAGKCDNLFNVVDSSFSLNKEAIVDLNEQRIHPGRDKTMLDLLYDEITQNNSSSFNQLNEDQLKENVRVEYFKNNY